MGSPPAKRVKMADTICDRIFTDSPDFATLTNHEWYVDKTLLIKTVLCELPPKILITAPPRFGKSLNMNMIKRFVEIEMKDNGERVKLEKIDEELANTQEDSKNFPLFVGKKILPNVKELDAEFFTRHFGQYPVIYLNFKRVGGNNYEEIYDSLTGLICKVFKKHSYLKTSKIWKGHKDFDENDELKFKNYSKKKNLSVWDIKTGLTFLSEMLCAHFEGERKVYVFIDEFDAPLTKALYNEELTYGADGKSDDLNKVVRLIGELISDLLKDNECVERALLHSSHHIGQVLSPLANNISYYQFLVVEEDTKNLWNFYGFTGGEVTALLNQLGIAEENIRQVEKFYNGYSFKWSEHESVQLYNTWSILNYLRGRVLKSYWAVGTFRHLLTLLSHDQIKPKIEKLMNSEEPITIVWFEKLGVDDVKVLKKVLNTRRILKSEVNLFIQFLYENGYLTVDKSDGSKLDLKIPNQEIRAEFHKTLFRADLVCVSYGVNLQHIENFVKSIEVLSQEKKEESVVQVANAIKELFSIRLPENEATFQSILFHSLCTKEDWRTLLEPRTDPTRNYRCDIAVFIRDEIGFVIELKIFGNHSSQQALNQLLTNKYRQILNKESIRDKIYLGIHMSKENESVKDVSITYLINDTEIDHAVTVSTTERNLNEN